jgi:hypothetical protein
MTMNDKDIADDIERYFDRFCTRGTQCREFLDLSLGRVLKKELEERFISDATTSHIVDWLKASIINRDAWISKLDDMGRPRKLMKFGSVAQIAKEADKAMLKAAQKSSNLRLVEGEEELHHQLRDGFYLVRLLTPSALDRESAEMQHCIGNGAYDDFLSDKGSCFLSLRDRNGKAHATIEIKDRCIIQCQGKQNRVPTAKYSDLLTDYFSERKYDSLLPAYRTGFVVDQNRNWHRAETMPGNIVINGDLNLREMPIDRLPNGISVLGSLILDGCPLEALPDGLVVGVNLDMSYTKIRKLPADLKVGRSIIATRSKLEDITRTWNIDGVLDLAYTPIKSLPDNLSAYGLDLTGTPIRELPKGLKVSCHLRVSKTPLKRLPYDLHVGDYLAIKGTKISEVPPLVSDAATVHSDGLPNMSARDFRALTVMQRLGRLAKHIKSYASEEISKRTPIIRGL